MSQARPYQQAFARQDRIVIATSLVSLLISGGLVWLLTSGPPSNATAGRGGRSLQVPSHLVTPSPTVVLPPSARVLSSDKDGITVVPELAALARELNAPETTIERDFEILGTLVEGFRRANNGKGPAGGENEEIIAQLRGHNPKHLAVIPSGLPFINTQGQLLDRWGTPFYFHPVSATSLGIRSAGPDHKLWTADDVLNEDQ